MRTLRQRYAVAATTMAVFAPLILYLQYSVPPPADIGAIGEAIPRHLDKWIADGPDRGGDEEEKKILQTDAILTRTYRCGSLLSCELSIVYAVDNPNAVHPPELCYIGSGWTEAGKDQIAVAVGERAYRLNRRLFSQSGGVRMWVLYWYKAGPDNFDSYIGFQLAALKARLFRSGCSCSLIQVRAKFDRPDLAEEVLAELRKFAAEVIPAVNTAVP